MYRNNNYKFLVALTILLLALAGTSQALIYVTPGGAGTQSGADWDNATSLTAAITASNAAGGDTLWLTSGTYTLSASLDALTSPIEVYGGFVGNETSLTSRSATYWDDAPTTIDGVGAYKMFDANGQAGFQIVLDGLKLVNGLSTANYVGAALRVDGGSGDTGTDVLITHCEFRGNANTASWGGAIAIGTDDMETVIEECTFDDNTVAAEGGGALFFVRGQLTVTTCTFTNCAGVNGGALYHGDWGGGATATLTNCVFANNTATAKGGGVMNSLAPIILVNCDFLVNTQTAGADWEGGGAMFADNAAITATGCTFDSNFSSKSGGAISSWSGSQTLSFTDCVFSNNTNVGGNRGGGAICTQDGGCTIIATDCTFTNNTSTGRQGGAIHCRYNLTLTNCDFTGNSANEGGAVWRNSGTNSNFVTNCTFTDNYSASIGGALCFFDRLLTATDCVFDQNESANHGGAVYMSWAGSGAFVNCDFTDNTSAGRGGAISAGGNGNPYTLSTTDCLFDGNETTASDGGAIWATTNPGVTLANTTFQNNTARYMAGAIRIAGTGVFNVTDCDFNNNSAMDAAWGNGGAIACINRGMVTTNTLIQNNQCGKYGGGIYFEPNDANALIATNCLLTDNSATSEAGAIYQANGVAYLVNCTLAGNDSTSGTNDGVYNMSDENCEIVNCAFGGHAGNAVSDGATGGVTYVYSSAFDTDDGGDLTAGTTDAGVVTGDVAFISTSAGDYDLGIGSVAVDAGGTSGTQSIPANDYIGEPHIGNADAGYLEAAPWITSIEPDGGVTTVYSVTSVIFDVVFNQPLNAALDATDLSITKTGTITGETLGTITTSDNQSFEVTVDFAGGSGDINLDFVDDLSLLAAGGNNLPYGRTASVAENFTAGTDITVITPLPIIYVTSAGAGVQSGADWANAMTLPNAVASSNLTSAGATLYMASGVYTLAADLPVLATSIEVYGGFDAAGTEIDLGDRSATYWDDNPTTINGVNTYKMFDANGLTAFHIVLDGLKLVNGISGVDFLGAALRVDGGTGDTSMDGDQVLITHCAFSGHQNTAGRGGAIMIGVDQPFGTVIEECTFDSNSALWDGGAIFLVRGDLQLTSSTITSCSGNYGGAMCFANWGSGTPSLTFTGCTFANNTAVNVGGAVYFDHVPCTVTDCDFVNNTQTAGQTWEGGGAVMIYTGDGVFTDCTFDSNNSSKNGGAVHLWSGTATETFVDCVFTNNHANSGNGGSICTQDNGCGIVATDCTFSQNSATGNGGAIRGRNRVIATNCIFDGNSATEGGSIWRQNNVGGVSLLSGCTFTGNYASSLGGAVTHFDDLLTITDSVFDQNSSANHGGAFYMSWTGRVALEGTEFTDNTSAGRGGAISTGGNGGAYTFTASNCLFEGNQTTNSDGGAIWASTNPNMTLTDCTFDSNVATYMAGAIRIDGTGTFNVVGCDFNNNQCLDATYGNGGAIACLNRGMVTTSTLFQNNQCARFGGGIYFAPNDSNALIATNCLLADNDATSEAGAIYQSNGAVYLVNCTLYGNNSTGGTNDGVYNVSDEDCEIVNCAIGGHAGNAISDIDGPTTGTTYVYYSAFNTGDGGTNGTTDSGNVTGDVAFVSSTLADYDLGAGSIAINAGVTSGTGTMPIPATDYFGTLRTGNPDAGYLEAAPWVMSIEPAGGVTSIPDATTVTFVVEFSMPINTLVEADLDVTKTGNIAGEAIDSITTSDNQTFVVVVTLTSGYGDLGLDFLDNLTIFGVPGNQPYGHTASVAENFTDGTDVTIYDSSMIPPPEPTASVKEWMMY